MQFIEGGVCAPMGFTANAVFSGVKQGFSPESVIIDGVINKRGDTALVVSISDCNTAGIFTKNRVKAEPVKLCKEILSKNSKTIRGVILNSGNANACTGEQGQLAAKTMCKAVANKLSNITENQILVCSTGVIGKQLPISVIEHAIPSLVNGLSTSGNELARVAIMTTDTRHKEFAVEFDLNGKKVKLGTMAKGSGMIHINMGTMLGVITTDCAISQKMLQQALQESAECTYNCVSVDGDTSTNDTLLVLANGMAGNDEITEQNPAYYEFLHALNTLNTEMAKRIAADGEGAEHLIECTVTGAKSIPTARKLAKSVISSSLVKAAFFGKDANWGRILCALGYSGEDFMPEHTCVSFASTAGYISLFENGVPLDFDETLAKKILSEDEVTILVQLKDGDACGTAWGCDLTHEYVTINGDYRT